MGNGALIERCAHRYDPGTACPVMAVSVEVSCTDIFDGFDELGPATATCSSSRSYSRIDYPLDFSTSWNLLGCIRPTDACGQFRVSRGCCSGAWQFCFFDFDFPESTQCASPEFGSENWAGSCPDCDPPFTWNCTNTDVGFMSLQVSVTALDDAGENYQIYVGATWFAYTDPFGSCDSRVGGRASAVGIFSDPIAKADLIGEHSISFSDTYPGGSTDQTATVTIS